MGVRRLVKNIKKYRVVNNIFRRYGELCKNHPDEEMIEALRYIKQNGPILIPYSLGDNPPVEILQDESCNLKYVIHEGKRLYFNAAKSDHAITLLVSDLINEQNINSPHCYHSENFDAEEGDILFDIGAAEGIYALSVINKVNKVVLFECESEWFEPLKKTFEPWNDKVVIVKKYVSDSDSDTTITIDSFLEQHSEYVDKSLLFKVDVEGAEESVLKGMKNTLANRNVKAAICVYHKRNDYATLSQMMLNHGYNVETSKRYMLLHDDWNDEYSPYYLTRGVIYCRKNV
jgi:hypothetical protein